jgi:hypothetical protein
MTAAPAKLRAPAKAGPALKIVPLFGDAMGEIAANALKTIIEDDVDDA